MMIEFERQKGMPVYLQLKEAIKKMIRSGAWDAGKKIPTERELAESLNLSRNTVSTAYKELEAEGILISTQGRGTFVTDSDAVIRRESRKERLLKIVDIAMEEAAELGFTIDEFVTITHHRGMEKKDMLSRVKVAFVECNREQLLDFSSELHLDSGVAILPVLLEDFRACPAEVNALLADVELVLTTFFHLEEVRGLIDDKRKDLIGIALNPQLETIVKIARLPQDGVLGVICASDTFVAKIKNSLRQAGIDHLQFKSSITKDVRELADLVATADAVVVSPHRKKDVTALGGKNKEVIEFRYLPDMGSINIVKTALLELKKK